MGPEMYPTPESSNIAEIGYDDDAAEAWVRFHSSHVYAYFPVPPVVWEEFRSAGSKGRFLNEVLKPSYACRRV
jgi:hypothetical protein